MQTRRSLTVKLDEETFLRLKLHAAQTRQTMQQVAQEAIELRLEVVGGDPLNRKGTIGLVALKGRKK